MPPDNQADQPTKRNGHVNTGLSITNIIALAAMAWALVGGKDGIIPTQSAHATEISIIKSDRERDRAELLVMLRDINRKLDCLQRGNRGVC